MAESCCFHCGQAIPANLQITVDIHDVEQGMCCYGCAAVAQAIVAGGLEDFYRHRTTSAVTAETVVPDILRKLETYNLPEVQKQFVHIRADDRREAALILEGIVCAACVWMSEKHIAALAGVESIQINFSTRRAQVVWDEQSIKLSQIIQAFSQIGYLAHPYDADRWQVLIEQERKQQLMRLSVAGLFGMQVMMIAVALYAADVTGGMQAQYQHFFYWVSLGLTLPILGYSAKPFFQSAWRDLNNRRPGMDLPVSLGISVAFLASAWATVTHQGVIYFDSVAMFVFFLLSGRYFELLARKRVVEAMESLVAEMPATAIRLSGESEETVAIAQLGIGDHVVVLPGQTIPADGKILDGNTCVDESLLTGESHPISKARDSFVLGGSVNRTHAIVVLVEKTGADTALSHIQRLLERAQAEKPRITQLADWVSAWFVSAVLLVALSVGTYWWLAGNALWLPILLSVLIVTCPCALSLATPTAMTAATGALIRAGVLTTRGRALEGLSKATHILFDKTGTLTTGRLVVQEVMTFAPFLPRFCAQLAAGLEQRSEHPLARALVFESAAHITQIKNVSGRGLYGQFQGQTVAIGQPDFVAQQVGCGVPEEMTRDGKTVVYLGWNGQLLGVFVLADEVKAGAKTLIARLKKTHQVHLLSGDQEDAVRNIAHHLSIEHAFSRMQPADKLAYVQTLQQAGAVVVMVGDGINDAPVLAAADVSVAMGEGASLAQVCADMILLPTRLDEFGFALQVANRTVRIIKQNMGWAVGYNLLALPLAASGYIAPWMAALGMSLSSVIVVFNALRLSKMKVGV